MSALRTFAAGFAVKTVMRVLGRERTPRRDRRALRPAPPARATAPLGPPRGPLAAFTVACLATGLPLMILFEATVTRVIGVLALFAFIIAGAFLIASPAFLLAEERSE
jgi:hypothetical protein